MTKAVKLAGKPILRGFSKQEPCQRTKIHTFLGHKYLEGDKKIVREWANSSPLLLCAHKIRTYGIIKSCLSRIVMAI